MKISKLFHWLYAFVMFLPVFFIGVRCGYVMLNKNAKDSYSGEYEQSETITKANTYVNLKSYLFLTSGESQSSFLDTFTFTFTRIYQPIGFSLDYDTYDSATISRTNNIRQIVFFNSNDNTQTQTITLNNSKQFKIEMLNCPNVTSYRNYILFYLYNFELNNNFTLDNAFEYSVNQLNETPLFSWAQTSFLVEPFQYISGLFGIAQESPINTLLSYWLSVSIIWLTFDLVMWLPLLAHRWIDKGVLE